MKDSIMIHNLISVCTKLIVLVIKVIITHPINIIFKDPFY